MNLKYHNSRNVMLVLYLASLTTSSVGAFTTIPPHSSFIPNSISTSTSTGRRPSNSIPTPTTLYSTTSSNKDTEDAFSAFAESLDEDDLFNDNSNSNSNGAFDSSSNGNGEKDVYSEATWQESLEQLLDPTTPLAKRQILLTDLLNSNENIREDVLAALRERKIDNLLTPTGKKLQDGTRAVARQITTDILPSLTALASTSATDGPSKTASDLFRSNDLLPTLVPKISSNIFDAVQNQAKKTIETISEDLANPSNIPQRISKQTATIATEAKNVFLETPEGLVGPKYDVVASADGYEIRDYEGYKVASTSMSKVGEAYSLDDITKSGTAFNTLAAYLFGANDEGKIMDMTTPVSTTSVGEMRFYLKVDDGRLDGAFPEPLSPEKDFNERGAVKIVDVPPARLAVAKFTGFVTEGEVLRQKDALLSSLAMDGVEVDTPHGVKIPHIVFQYNPPYTIPIVRRNEIAIPVRSEEDFIDESNINLESEWKDDNDTGLDDISPSDVE